MHIPIKISKQKILLALVGIGVAVIITCIYFSSNSHHQIIKAKNKQPVIPQNISAKKQHFFSLMIPAIQQVYQDLATQFKQIDALIKSSPNSHKIKALKQEYKVASDIDLLRALKPHPISIVIAQAAMESAWGRSRFFLQANNIFGVWSFNKNEPRIAANKKRGKKTIWVKKYPSIKAAIIDYYKVIATGSAFKKFRELRLKTNNPYELVKKLNKYSEKGYEYTQELAAMIKFNKLDQL